MLAAEAFGHVLLHHATLTSINLGGLTPSPNPNPIPIPNPNPNQHQLRPPRASARAWARMGRVSWGQK